MRLLYVAITTAVALGGTLALQAQKRANPKRSARSSSATTSPAFPARRS